MVLLDETGVDVRELGSPVREDYVEVPIEGRLLRQHQTFFRVRVEATAVDVSGWTALERRTVAEYRWWSAEELRDTTETCYPADLADLLEP